MGTSHVEIGSVTESQALINSIFILTFTQPLTPSPPIIIDLFIDDDMVLVVGTKRCWEEELQDPTKDFDQALKRISHNSRFFNSIDKWR